jgi:hypothetical protein
MQSINTFFREEDDYLYKRGKKREAFAIAKELKKEGLAPELIAKTTKLSIKEIEKL